MKTMILVAALALSFSSVEGRDGLVSSQSFVVTKADAVQEFGYFRIHRQADDVSLNWAIADPSTVSFFSIERSFDGSWFFALDQVACSPEDATYKYRDTGAFPGYLYYRVVAHLTDGSTVSSPVEMIRIVSRKG